MKGGEQRSLASGMDGYVSKPLKIEEIFSVIENVALGITRGSDGKGTISQRLETPATK